MKNRNIRVILTILLCLCWNVFLSAYDVMAASNELNLDLTDPQVTPMPSMFGLFLRLFISLVIIGGLAFVTMKLLRRNMKFFAKGANIEVLDQYSFSLNKGLYITQVVDKVFVLGVTDHNINLITEITDRDLIEEITLRAKEKDMEALIPAGIFDRISKGLFSKNANGRKSFNSHIQQQIKKLQSIVEHQEGKPRDDNRKE